MSPDGRARRTHFGSSGLSLIESRYSHLLVRLNITLTNGPTDSADLTPIPPDMWELLVRRGLEPAVVLEVAGIQLGLLVTGALKGALAWWVDDPCFERERRRDWLKARRWAANHLIDDETMVFALDSGWTVEDLATNCEVTLQIAQVRHQEWARANGLDVPFYAL